MRARMTQIQRIKSLILASRGGQMKSCKARGGLLNFRLRLPRDAISITTITSRPLYLGSRNARAARANDNDHADAMI